jgi:excisionase family DNA binding protein
MAQKQDEVLTTKEVMDRLKVTRPTVIKLYKQGKIRAVKVGRDYRFIRADVEKFIYGDE